MEEQEVLGVEWVAHNGAVGCGEFIWFRTHTDLCEVLSSPALAVQKLAGGG